MISYKYVKYMWHRFFCEVGMDLIKTLFPLVDQAELITIKLFTFGLFLFELYTIGRKIVDRPPKKPK
jgi:hypothetical protein